jgi:hypothetical protein
MGRQAVYERPEPHALNDPPDRSCPIKIGFIHSIELVARIAGILAGVLGTGQNAGGTNQTPTLSVCVRTCHAID